MTDKELVLKKLAVIETSVHELRTVANLELLETDIREARFIERTLQIAVQATLDVASHIVSDERLGEPETNRALFALLARSHFIDSALAQKLSSMAGFRNVLVHAYDTIQHPIVRDIVENHLDDLLTYCAAIRTKL